MTVANDTPVREIWNRRVTQDHVLRLFGEWRTPWLDLPALIRRTPEIYEFPLADRDRCKHGRSAASRLSATPPIRCSRGRPGVAAAVDAGADAS